MRRDELRQALDDSVLMHTGRSIGDLASQRVVDDIWPLIEAYEAQGQYDHELVRKLADARDAALEIVRVVAEARDYDSGMIFWNDTTIEGHSSDIIKQARALLAEAADGEQE